MNTPYPMSDAKRRIVYVKAVAVTDLPEELRATASGRDRIYSVHTEDGEQLALVADRALAYVLARQHDFKPVAVH